MTSAVTFQDFKACMELVSQRLDSEVPYINSGGCAFFASELLKRMEAAGMTECYVGVFGDIEDYGEDEDGFGIPNVNVIEHKMLSNSFNPYDKEDWNANGINFAHVVIEWEGTKWDALRPFTADTWSFWPRYEGDFNPDVLHHIGQDPRGWNCCFDWNNCDLIREILDEAFDVLLNVE